MYSKDATTYTYGDGNRPYAPTNAAGAATYTYYRQGQVRTRTTSGQTQTYDWTADGLIETITGPCTSGGGTGTGTCTAGNAYTADGQRLLRADMSGALTIYVGIDEITTPTYSGTPTARRSYTLGNATIGVRTTGGYTIILGDRNGTPTTSVTSTGTVSRRYFTPYGTSRGTTPAWPNDHKYLNQVNDPNNITYLNARYYDPAAATFLSVDPLVTSTRQPYLYGNGNPVAYADPTGQYSCPDGNCNYWRDKPQTVYVPKDMRPDYDTYLTEFANATCLQEFYACARSSLSQGLDPIVFSVMQAAALGLVVIDSDGRVQAIQDGFSITFGWNRTSAEYGNAVLSLIPTASWADAVAALQLVLPAVQFAGAGSCAFTGGAGCGVAAAASGINAGIDGASAAWCHMSAGEDCGLKTAVAVLSIGSAGASSWAGRSIDAAAEAGRITADTKRLLVQWSSVAGIVVDGNIVLPLAWGPSGGPGVSIGADGRSISVTSTVHLMPAQ